MRFRPVLAALLLAVVLLTPSIGLGQSDRGNIEGVVRDTSKAVIPGVSVRVVNTATNATTELVTSETGAFTATNLPPGTYRVEASLVGFRSAVVGGVILNVGATAKADITLDLGSVNETVTVEAKQTVVETTDAKVSTKMPNQLIDQLPLVVGGAMRSVFDLVATIPETKGSGNAVSLGGGQGGAFGASLDGVSVNTNRAADTTETAFLTPSVEAITEFSVETNGFKPEYGQAGGGGITFASKSGTNRFQGSVYEFFRDDALDKKGYFEKQKGDFKQHNYGAAGGGPIRIPGLYNGTDRSFFFVSFEGFRNVQATNGAVFSVPTPEMLTGDFSKWVDGNGKPIQIYDPATTRPNPSGSGYVRDPFLNNQIPVSRFSKVAQQYLALIKQYNLTPNNGAAPGTPNYVRNNYTSAGGTTLETTQKFSLKLDHTLNNSNRFNFLFNRASNLVRPGDAGPAGLPAPFNAFQQSSYDADLYRAGWDWNSAKMVNRLTLGWNTFNKDAFSVNVGKDWKSTVCIPNAVDCNVNMGRVSFTEFSTWGGLADNGTEQPRFTIKDDFSFLARNHMLKAGFIYDRQQANGFGQQNIAGLAGFDFRETSIPGATTLAGGGSSFASFLLGAADTGATETIRYLQQIYPYYAGYLQDDWRINSRLTVNFGVRYEYTAPPRAGGDKYSDLDPSRANPAVNDYPGALVFAGSGDGRTGTRTMFNGYTRAFAPRVSGAYSLDERTTFRAGIGRSFGRVTVTQSSSHYSGFIGQYAFASTDSGVTPAFSLDSGLPYYPLPPQINPAFANNTNVDWFNGDEAGRPAVYDTWTASVQRELFPGFAVEFDYNGSHGSHLQATLLNPNQVSMDVVNNLIAQLGPAATAALLNSQITSAAAVAAGIKPPYPSFKDPKVQQSRTVAQALRRFPQYLNVDLASGGGDKTGRSWYHAGVVKVTQRMRNGLAVQASYTYSRLMTDADSFSGSGGSIDAAHPELEYSIGRFDQPHNIKINAVYELPFGEGRRWIQKGIGNAALGGWRVSFSGSYSSGYPIGVTSNGVLNVFNRTNRPNVVPGAAWRAPISGSEFDPAVDKWLSAAAFVQPVGALGNAPRTNGDVRNPWSLNENISIAKTFKIAKARLDFRVEAFNLFNRVVWGAPNTNFSSNQFGVISSQANQPRRMQLGLKFYW